MNNMISSKHKKLLELFLFQFLLFIFIKKLIFLIIEDVFKIFCDNNIKVHCYFYHKNKLKIKYKLLIYV